MTEKLGGVRLESSDSSADSDLRLERKDFGGSRLERRELGGSRLRWRELGCPKLGLREFSGFRLGRIELWLQSVAEINSLLQYGTKEARRL